MKTKKNIILSSAISAWVLGLGGNHVHAACDILGQIVTCSGNSGGFTSNIDNLTMNILIDGLLNSDNKNVVHLLSDGDVTINNNGVVQSTQADNAILIDGNDVNIFTLNNNGIIQNLNNHSVTVESANIVNINNVGQITGQKTGIYLNEVAQTASIENDGFIEGLDGAGIYIGEIDKLDALINNNYIKGQFGVVIIDGQDLKIVNSQGANIIGENGSAIHVLDSKSDDNDTFRLINDGDIKNQGGLGFAALEINKISTIDVVNNGVIRSVLEKAIFANTFDAFSLTNTVAIRSDSQQAILLEDNDGISDVVINNSGLILSESSTNTIELRNIQSTTINNNGKIFNEVFAFLDVYGAIKAVDNQNLDNDTLVVNNDVNGEIQGLGDFGNGILSENINTVIINNKNLIEGAQSALKIYNSFDTIINNESNGVMTSYAGDVIVVADSGNDGINDKLLLTNNGQIITQNQAASAINVYAIEDAIIHNNGLISSNNADAIFLNSNMFSEVINTGSILAPLGFSLYVYDPSALVGDTFQLVNYGLIDSFSGNRIEGICSINIENNALIKSNSNTLALIDFDAAYVENTNTIQTIGENGIAIYAFDAGNTIENDSLTLINSGLIEAANNGAKAVYVKNIATLGINNSGNVVADSIALEIHDALTTTIGNSGLIQSLNDFAITASSTKNTDNDSFSLVNSGDIEGFLGIKTEQIFDVSIENSGNIIVETQPVTINDAYIASLINSGNIMANSGQGVFIWDLNADNVGDIFYLDNSGLISANAPALQTLNIDDVYLKNSGSILSKNNEAIDVKNVIDLGIENAGLIQSDNSWAILVEDNVQIMNDTFTLINSGDIYGFLGVKASQISAVDIKNSGNITAENQSITIEDALTTALINSGNITANSGQAILIWDLGNDTIDDSFTFDNSGLISANAPAIQTLGIDHIVGVNTGTINSKSDIALHFVDAQTTLIDNFGTIETINGTIAMLSEGHSQDILNHYGDIQGDVMLEAGNDQVALYSGMTINGNIDAGDDFDTLYFRDYNGTGHFNLDQAFNFENAFVESALWEMTGTGATHFDSFNVVGGTLTPGGESTYNHLTINTDHYNQTTDGNLLIGLNLDVSGQNDHVTIQGGDATLGGHLILSTEGDVKNIKTNTTHSYTVLQADQSVNGEFDTVTDVIQPSLVLSQNVRYNPNDVVIEFNRKAYEDAGLTQENDIAWAAYHSELLDKNLYSGDITAYLDYLDSIDHVADLEQALRKNNGEVYDVFAQGMLQASRNTMTTIANRLNQRDCDQGCQSTRIWLEGAYGNSDLDSIDEHNQYQINQRGFIGGIEVDITDNLTVGAAVNYYDIDANIELDDGTRVGDASGNVMGIEAFLNHRGLITENSYITAAAGYQRGSDLQMDRAVTFYPVFTRQFHGETDAWALNGMLELGWNFTAGDVDINPYARAMVTRLEIDGIEEESRAGESNLALSVDPETVTQVVGELGVNVGTSFDMGSATIKPHLNLNVQHASNDRELDVRYRDLTGQTTRIKSNDGGETLFGTGAGVDIQFGKSISVGIDGNYQTGDGFDAWQVGAKLKVTF